MATTPKLHDLTKMSTHQIDAQLQKMDVGTLFELIGDCERAAPSQYAEIAQDRAAVTTTAVLQIASAGFAPNETRRQIEDILRDDYIDFARELAAGSEVDRA